MKHPGGAPAVHEPVHQLNDAAGHAYALETDDALGKQLPQNAVAPAHMLFRPLVLIEGLPGLGPHVQVWTVQAVYLGRIAHVKHLGEFLVDPRPRVVLAGIVQHPYLAQALVQRVAVQPFAHVVQRLCQGVGACVDGKVYRTRVVFQQGADDDLAALRALARPHGLHAESLLPAAGDRKQVFGGGPAGGVLHQIGPHHAVCLNAADDGFGKHVVLQPAGGHRDQAFNVDLIGVEQQPDHGLGIVRLVLHVRQNDKPFLLVPQQLG